MPVVVGALFLAAWTIAVRAADVPPIVLPTPVQCVVAAWENAGELARGFASTAGASVAGLVIAAIATGGIATALASSRWVHRALFPYVLWLQTVPVVAVAPLLIVWSGYSFRTVLIVTVMVCLFPMVNATVLGLQRVRGEHLDLWRIYGGSNSRRLLSLAWPTAVPDFVGGLKTGAPLAVIGAIVAEFFVANGTGGVGLGTLMTAYRMRARTDALIAAVVLSGVLGLALYAAVDRGSRRVARRWLGAE